MGCRADSIKIGGVTAVLCSVILYYLGRQWVHQDEHHIAELFVAGIGPSLSIVVAYWLRELRMKSPSLHVSHRVLLLLAVGATLCVYSILYMQTAGLYWQPRVAGVVAFLVYAVAGYVVWYRPYKLTAPADEDPV